MAHPKFSFTLSRDTMTDLRKPVSRRTTANRFSRGKQRPIIGTLDPLQGIGFRLHGERHTFWLAISAGHAIALAYHHQQQKELRKAAREARRKERQS